MPSSLNL